jgi:hypothetical protein
MVPQMLFWSCLIKVEQNCTKINNKKIPTKCPNFKWNTVSVNFSECRCSLVVFSSKIGREEEKSLETGLWMATCGCGLPAHCCHPAVAGGIIYADLRSELSTHLALQALFTQSSGYKLSPFQAHWGRWHCTWFLRPACLFTVHVGSGSYPLSCGVFLPLPLLQAFLLLTAGCVLLLLPASMFFTAYVGGGSSPLSCAVFLLPPLSQAFLLLFAGHAPLLLPSPL